MESQRQTVLACKKLKVLGENLKASLLSKNGRLVQKYVSEVNGKLDDLTQALVSVELEGLDENEPWIVEARKFDKIGQTLVFEAESFLLESEDKEVRNAQGLVNEAKVNELISSILTFKDTLRSSVVDQVGDVEISRQARVIHGLIDERKEQMGSFKKQKLDLFGTVKLPTDSMNLLSNHYNAVSALLNEWIEKAIKYVGQSGQDVPVGKPSRGPGLNLDRLSPPVFKGNVRAFARFVREFEATVGVEFEDPKIRVMYLQNQCLAGPAKEMVRNLTSYEEVMSRLKERYGKV